MRLARVVSTEEPHARSWALSPKNNHAFCERFFHIPCTADSTGVGLGFATLREMVVSHGGSIASVEHTRNKERVLF